MDPLLIAALARLAVKLGMNLFQLLQGEGVQFTNEELRHYRAETQRVVDEWNQMNEEEGIG